MRALSPADIGSDRLRGSSLELVDGCWDGHLRGWSWLLWSRRTAGVARVMMDLDVEWWLWDFVLRFE